ncbi:MAG: ROK family protein [Acidimicrobiales bacterium]
MGVDVGGTKMLGLVLDAGGTVTAEQRRVTPSGGEELTAALVALVTDLVGETAGSARVGVGLPGLVDRAGTLRFAPNLPGVVEVSVGPTLASATGLPVTIDNDATCAAWAEHVQGAAHGVGDALLVTVGTGIGGGLLLGGRLVRGASGFAGELGHMVVETGGIACWCGRRGCWERYASGTALGCAGRELARTGGGRLAQLAGGDPDQVRGEHVIAAARQGDADAGAAVERVSGWLGLGLANLVHILDVEVVVLGGGLVDAADVLLDPVRRALGQRVFAPDHRPSVPVVAARLGERAGAIGAALLAREPGEVGA